MIFVVCIVFIGLKQKLNLNHMQKYARKKHDFCDIVMSNEKNKELKHNQYQKSIRVVFIIYADL